MWNISKETHDNIDKDLSYYHENKKNVIVVGCMPTEQMPPFDKPLKSFGLHGKGIHIYWHQILNIFI